VGAVRKAARKAYSLLLGGASSIFDVEASREHFRDVMREFEDDLADTTNVTTAQEIATWLRDRLCYSRDPGVERMWAFFLLDLRNSTQTEAIEGIGDSVVARIRTIVEHELAEVWMRFGNLRVEAAAHPRSAWDRIADEHVGPAEQGMHGASVLGLSRRHDFEGRGRTRRIAASNGAFAG
jgi:hypothetical protein